METNKDIYLTAGRKTRRYEFALLESQLLRLKHMSAAYGRSIPDLITEGISIVLLCWEKLNEDDETEEDEEECDENG